MSKTRTVVRGDVVYEIDRRTKKPKHIYHGVEKYFKARHEGEDIDEYDEDEYYEPEPVRSPRQKHKDLLKLMGNTKKLVTKADGLDKEISIDDRRKKKHKPKTKRSKSKRGK